MCIWRRAYESKLVWLHRVSIGLLRPFKIVRGNSHRHLRHMHRLAGAITRAKRIPHVRWEGDVRTSSIGSNYFQKKLHPIFRLLKREQATHFMSCVVCTQTDLRPSTRNSPLQQLPLLDFFVFTSCFFWVLLAFLSFLIVSSCFVWFDGVSYCLFACSSCTGIKKL